ncbi:MAG TPA: hypothetical protein DCM10_02975 [Xanthomarina gelatinilytica]|nr:hypothetical protein [Xanthomarina gelatinilytica]
MIIQVPKEDLHIIWNEIEPLIKKALDDCYTTDDILKGLVFEKFQLFISWENKVESAVVTEVAQYPQKKILRYFLAGGNNINNWLEPIQEKIEKFAKLNNCNSIEVAGRKGWARKLKGYEQKIYLFSKEL